jgi:hypothetical protein
MDEEEILQQVIEETIRERKRLESTLIEERRKWRTKRNER